MITSSLSLFLPFRHQARLFKIGMSVFLSLLFIPTGQSQNIDYVNATFSIQYNSKLADGEGHLKIKRHQSQYHVNFDVDHWMSKANQQADFSMKNCQVQPQRYSSSTKRPLKPILEQYLSFNWQTKQAHYQDTGEQKTFDLYTTLYDPLSFFFEARCDLLSGKTEFSYPLIYKGKLKTHTYRVVGKENVETDQGLVEAIVIERQRSNKHRKTLLYVAPELDYLLVKITHQESRIASINLTLKHMEYQIQSF